MASTAEQTRTRYDELVDLAEVRGVGLGYIEIRDPSLWVAFVEELLNVNPDRPVPKS